MAPGFRLNIYVPERDRELFAQAKRLAGRGRFSVVVAMALSSWVAAEIARRYPPSPGES